MVRCWVSFCSTRCTFTLHLTHCSRRLIWREHINKVFSFLTFSWISFMGWQETKVRAKSEVGVFIPLTSSWRSLNACCVMHLEVTAFLQMCSKFGTIGEHCPNVLCDSPTWSRKPLSLLVIHLGPEVVNNLAAGGSRFIPSSLSKKSFCK